MSPDASTGEVVIVGIRLDSGSSEYVHAAHPGVDGSWCSEEGFLESLADVLISSVLSSHLFRRSSPLEFLCKLTWSIVNEVCL